jgi:hypothetical protein
MLEQKEAVFVVRSFGGVVFAVQSFRGVVILGLIIWRCCLCGLTLQFDHMEAFSVRFDIHHHCHNHCTIHVGQEVFFRWSLKGKQGKRIRGECASNVITGA